MKVFFLDNKTGAGRDDYDADLNEAINVFYTLSDTLGSFFGLVNDSGEIVQFAWIDDDKLLINIPLPERDGALHKYADYATCQQVIIDYYHGKSPELLDDLMFKRF